MTETICRIGIFLLCAQVLVHFRPKPVYEKYCKLLVSAMLLAQLLQPFLELWGSGEGLEDAANGSRESVRLLEERLENQGIPAGETETEETESGNPEPYAEQREIQVEWEGIGEIKVD